MLYVENPWNSRKRTSISISTQKLSAQNRPCLFNLNFNFQKCRRCYDCIACLQEYDFEIRYRNITLHRDVGGAFNRKLCTESCRYCPSMEKKY